VAARDQVAEKLARQASEEGAPQRILDQFVDQLSATVSHLPPEAP
jgi:hypothetical protein